MTLLTYKQATLYTRTKNSPTELPVYLVTIKLIPLYLHAPHAPIHQHSGWPPVPVPTCFAAVMPSPDMEESGQSPQGG